jgi:hypothetical protein
MNQQTLFEDPGLSLAVADTNLLDAKRNYQIGMSGECLVQSKLLFMGFKISQDLTDGTPEDLFLHYKSLAVGIQVKTCTQKKDQKHKDKSVWRFDFRKKNTTEVYKRSEVLLFAMVSLEKEKVIFYENIIGNRQQFKFDVKDFDLSTNKRNKKIITDILKNYYKQKND